MLLRSPWFLYGSPFLAYAGLASFENAGGTALYPVAYSCKLALTAGLLLVCRSVWGDMAAPRRAADVIVPLLAGILVFGLWVGLDKLVAYPRLGERTAFDPFAEMEEALGRSLFLAARFLGLVVVVPVMEELFFRSFLIRLFSSPERTLDLPPGRFRLEGALISGLLFTLVHPEWPAAAATAAAYTLVLARTRTVLACVIAHATTNLSLGCYIVATGSWHYW